MTYLDVAAQAVEAHEALLRWMYRDTVGVVTVAIGKALFTVGAALGLPFMLNGIRATVDDVQRDYERVAAIRMGQTPMAYRAKMSPLLDEDVCRAMLRTELVAFDTQLQTRFPGYGAAPDQAKVALLDMAYNLGVNGLLNFRHLCAAVLAKQWRVAALNCHRVGPSKERNDWTVAQFNAAAG